MKIVYIILGIFGVLISGLLITFLFLNFYWGRDIPPIDDSDLWLSKIEIKKEENAFYPLEKAGEKLYLPKEKEKAELFQKMAEGEEWDSKFAEELITNNKGVFDYFEEALKLPYFQVPEWQDPKNIDLETPVPNLSRLRNIARLNSIRANYLLIQGKEKEALDLTIKTIKMGQILEDSPRPSLISYLLGVAVKETGLQRLRIMIPKLTLSPEILKSYIAELNRFTANEEGLVRAMKMEYIAFTNAKSLKNTGIEGDSFVIKAINKLKYLYKPNQTQKMFADYSRNFINNVDKNYIEMESPESKPSLAPHQSKIKMLLTENVFGKIVYDAATGAYSGLLNKKCLEDFSVRGTQLLIAIKAYQIENGKIPSSLDELVPKYFSEIPKDPFSGRSLGYSMKKKIIYSVGKDLEDSGGSKGKDWRTMEDPTFEIEF